MASQPLAPDSPHLADRAGEWRSAYVHIPFCRRRCPYCDFAVVTPEEMPDGTSQAGYVDALIAEIGMEPDWGELDAVNIGGGTPTAVAADEIGRVITALQDRFELAQPAEVSVEANPEDVTPQLVATLGASGVNRLSLGIQSFDAAVLEQLGRAHSPADAVAAVAASRSGGVDSVSIDLIYGTPGESVDSWAKTVEQALELSPDHLSAYSLTVELGTALSRAVAGGAPGPDPDDQADKYLLLLEMTAAAGLVRYEVSNFALPGHPCRYNLATWAQGDYVAFGLGAHGHRAGRRRRNVRRLDRYLEAIAAEKRPEAGTETVEGWEVELERLMLGLRRAAGAVMGDGGAALLESADGDRLVGAGVVEAVDGRLVVVRPLLTDAAVRAVLALGDPANGRRSSRRRV